MNGFMAIPVDLWWTSQNTIGMGGVSGGGHAPEDEVTWDDDFL